MHSRQAEIIAALNVQPPFADAAALQAEIRRRTAFIQQVLRDSGLKVLVLGISGGVDSTVAGRLAQLAVEQLRAETGDAAYRFIAVRLPHGAQHDEQDARDAMDFIAADVEDCIDIAPGVQALVAGNAHLAALTPARADFVQGNVKARLRMVAQYLVANAHDGLVIGTDHAAEALMGFFTKFGDGACDLAPLTGLVKHQVRAIARALAAPEHLVVKTPTADLEALRPGRPDEDAYGVSYAQIDSFLHGGVIDAEAEAIILRTYAASAHKRAMPRVPD